MSTKIGGMLQNYCKLYCVYIRNKVVVLNQLIQKTELDNGVTVITDYMPEAYSATVGAWIPRGSRHEKESFNGLSHFYEHLVFKGTENRSSLEIVRELEDLGGSLDAYTTRQETGFYAQVSKEDVFTALEVVGDLLMNPLFEESELEKERKVIIEEIKSYDDIAEERVGDLFNELHFEGCGLAMPIAGTLKSVKSITLENLRDFRRQVIEDLPIYVCAAGNVKHQEMVDQCAIIFQKKKKGNISFPLNYKANRGLKVINKQELQQSSLYLGTSFLKAPLPKEFRFAFSIFNVSMGSGMSSRLFQKIREENGLAYSIFSMADSYKDCYSWGVSLATAPKRLEKATGLIQKEIDLFLKEGFFPGELERTKQNIIGAMKINADSTDKRTLRLAEQQLHLGHYCSMQDIEDGINSVSKEQVVEMTRLVLKNDFWAAAVVQPASAKIPTVLNEIRFH